MNGDTLQIHASEDGIVGSRMYTWAGNLADAIWWLMTDSNESSFYFKSSLSHRPQRWNIAGERDVSNLELAQLVAKYLDMPLKYELVSSHHPSHGQRFALDTTKITKAGWHPKINFEHSLKDIVEWTAAHPLWRERVAQ
jgi:dTDP-glucose 4,6-dehydratase